MASNNASLGFAFVVLVAAAFLVAGPDRVITGLLVAKELSFDGPTVVKSGDVYPPGSASHQNTVCNGLYYIAFTSDSLVTDGARVFSRVGDVDQKKLGACYQLVTAGEASTTQLAEAASAPSTGTTPSNDAATVKTDSSGLTLYTMNKYGFYGSDSEGDFIELEGFANVADFLNQKRGSKEGLKDDVSVKSASACEVSEEGVCTANSELKGKGGFAIVLDPTKKTLTITVHDVVVQQTTSKTSGTASTQPVETLDKKRDFTLAAMLVLESLMKEEQPLDSAQWKVLKAAIAKKTCTAAVDSPLKIVFTCNENLVLATASSAPGSGGSTPASKLTLKSLHSVEVTDVQDKIDLNKPPNLAFSFALTKPCDGVAENPECSYELKIDDKVIIASTKLPPSEKTNRNLVYYVADLRSKLKSVPASAKAVLTLTRTAAGSQNNQELETDDFDVTIVPVKTTEPPERKETPAPAPQGGGGSVQSAPAGTLTLGSACTVSNSRQGTCIPTKQCDDKGTDYESVSGFCPGLPEDVLCCVLKSGITTGPEAPAPAPAPAPAADAPRYELFNNDYCGGGPTGKIYYNKKCGALSKCLRTTNELHGNNLYCKKGLVCCTLRVTDVQPSNCRALTIPECRKVASNAGTCRVEDQVNCLKSPPEIMSASECNALLWFTGVPTGAQVCSAA